MTEYLINNTPIEKTIRDCTDSREFVSIRTVNGGAIYEGKVIGKSIRWYYSTLSEDCIRYVKNNNKVPKTEGARPMMQLCEELPLALDYNWYNNEATDILKGLSS